MVSTIAQQLASEEISLSKALAKSKIIVSKLDNIELKVWLNYELIGYPSDIKENIPDYRKFHVDVKGILMDTFGNISEINIDLEPLSNYVGENLNIHHEKSSIVAIEDLLRTPKADYVQSFLTVEMLRIFNSSVKQPGNKLIKAYREYHINNLKNILIQVKQKLLDTLLNIDEEFPNLGNNYDNTKESKDKVQNIVNFNVFGGNPVSNFGIGAKVIQKDFVFNEDAAGLLKKLLELNVPEEEISEVSAIINNTPKESLSHKLMMWFGNLSIKMVEKGLELKLPLILDSINSFISSV